MAKRTAIIVAVALGVNCPHCGEPQPCPTGSEMWEPREVKEEQGERACVSCDKKFRIAHQDRVGVL